MSKTISDKKLKYAIGIITQEIEPRVKTMVESLNQVFHKQGIRAGVELQWIFDEVEINETNSNNKSK
jgi:hypothetical protein